MIQIYSSKCTPCAYRSQLAHIKHFARSIGTEVEIYETKYRPDYQESAAQLSSLPLPFVYNTDTKASKPLKEVTKGFTL